MNLSNNINFLGQIFLNVPRFLKSQTKKNIETCDYLCENYLNVKFFLLLKKRRKKRE
jgi:hypothetical protein